MRFVLLIFLCTGCSTLGSLTGSVTSTVADYVFFWRDDPQQEEKETAMTLMAADPLKCETDELCYLSRTGWKFPTQEGAWYSQRDLEECAQALNLRPRASYWVQAHTVDGSSPGDLVVFDGGLRYGRQGPRVMMIRVARPSVSKQFVFKDRDTVYCVKAATTLSLMRLTRCSGDISVGTCEREHWQAADVEQVDCLKGG